MGRRQGLQSDGPGRAVPSWPCSRPARLGATESLFAANLNESFAAQSTKQRHRPLVASGHIVRRVRDMIAASKRRWAATASLGIAMIVIHHIVPDDWLRWRRLRLNALREVPQAFSSTLAEWQGSGDNEARWRARLTAVPFNVIASLDGADAGTCSGTAPDNEIVELISMWVAPFARGHGVSDTLFDAIVCWAQSQSALSVTLNVFEDNARAIALFARHGFADRGVVAANGSARRSERIMSCDFR